MAAIAALGTAIGCGGDDEPPSQEDQIRSTLDDLQTAYRENDAALGCENITRRAHILIGVMGHDTPAACVDEVAKAFRWMYGDPGTASEPQPTPELVDVEIDGRRATATVAAPGNPAIEAPFVKADGEWRLDSVFGTEVASFQSDSGYYDEEVEFADAKAMTKPVASAGVAARERGRACSAVDTRRAPALDGGCVLPVTGTIDMGVTSVFGTWKFDDPCKVRLSLRIDGRGRTWSRGFVAAGNSPCPDVKPCGKGVGGTGIELPWRGRIERGEDGALYHRFDRACLNTCLGLFRGPLRTKLVESGRGWRLETDKTNVGVSGWQFNNDLEAPESAVQFASGRSAPSS